MVPAIARRDAGQAARALALGEGSVRRMARAGPERAKRHIFVAVTILMTVQFFQPGSGGAGAMAAFGCGTLVRRGVGNLRARPLRVRGDRGSSPFLVMQAMLRGFGFGGAGTRSCCSTAG